MAFNFSHYGILVVDDDPAMRSILKGVLEQFKFKFVHSCSEGGAAFDLFREHSHDIILTDYQMEPVNGVELTQMVRRKKLESPNVQVPIILASGDMEISVVKAARNVGVNELLIKPFATNDLAVRIAYVFNKPRQFINLESYMGPDRRRRNDPKYKGPMRRKTDSQQSNNIDVGFR